MLQNYNFYLIIFKYLKIFLLRQAEPHGNARIDVGRLVGIGYERIRHVVLEERLRRQSLTEIVISCQIDVYLVLA